MKAARTGSTGNPLFDAGARQALERDGLSAFLQRQRWFAGKARDIRQARFVDWGTLDGHESSVCLTIVEARYSDGETDRYFVPLIVAEQLDPAVSGGAVGGVLADVTGAYEGCLCDAVASDAACELLVTAMRTPTVIEMTIGRVDGWRGPAPCFELSALRPVIRAEAEQSNTSLFFGDQIVMKLFRRLEAGQNPELEVPTFLSDSGFSYVPQPAGALMYHHGGDEPTVLACAHSFVANRGSGWNHALREVRQYLESVASSGGAPEVHSYLPAAARLGQRTAELHGVLSRGDGDPAFTPEQVTAGDLSRLVAEMQDRAEATCALLEQQRQRIPEPARRMAGSVLAERGLILQWFRALRSTSGDWMNIRVHGDYHLGQVLRVEDNFTIIDFEGEPSRPLRERRRRQSALKDVAGMLRSFSYVAHLGLLAFATETAGDRAEVESWASTWEASISAEFLRTYRAAAAGQRFVPAGRQQFDSLLDAFLMDKALYELRYELNHRTDWVATPLWGIWRLLAHHARGR